MSLPVQLMEGDDDMKLLHDTGMFADRAGDARVIDRLYTSSPHIAALEYHN